jgi:hypothetical protein
MFRTLVLVLLLLTVLEVVGRYEVMAVLTLIWMEFWNHISRNFIHTSVRKAATSYRPTTSRTVSNNSTKTKVLNITWRWLVWVETCRCKNHYIQLFVLTVINRSNTLIKHNRMDTLKIKKKRYLIKLYKLNKRHCVRVVYSVLFRLFLYLKWQQNKAYVIYLLEMERKLQWLQFHFLQVVVRLKKVKKYGK